MKTRQWLIAVLSLGMMASTAAASAQYYGPQNGPPPGYGDRGGWDQAPREFRDAMRRGYNDGVNGARKDFENHRRPTPNNRDEYRNPSFIAPPDRHDYRIGFRRGYQVAVQHIYGNRRR